MRTARDQPGNYGRRFAETRMVYDVAEEEDREDDYIITLTFRPEGDFAGTPGQEQFFIEKEGIVAHRQVLSLPSRARWWRSRVALVSVGIVVVVAVVVGGVIATIGRDGSGDAVPLAAALPTGTPERPTLIPSPGPTTAAEGIPPVAASPNPVPAPLLPPPCRCLFPQHRLRYRWQHQHQDRHLPPRRRPYPSSLVCCIGGLAMVMPTTSWEERTAGRRMAPHSPPAWRMMPLALMELIVMSRYQIIFPL